ncbi:MAG: dihydrolipoyl dehydrogenase family protein [Rhodothermales bacterium]
MAYEFDMIVIGGGAAGLTTSGIAASFGAKTLMIERDRLGGDCTWTGCVPSKTLLKSAKAAHIIRHASYYGLVDQDLTFDFRRMMQRLHEIREEVYEDADKPELYEAMGVEVRFGQACFVDEHTLEIDGKKGVERVTSRFFTIAAGAGAWVPPIDGLQDVPYLTNHTLFELAEQPDHLAIVGGGPIGTEMSQAFRRLGSRVTVIDMLDTILSKDDPELTAMLRGVLEKEGVEYVLNAGVKTVSQGGGTIRVEVEQNGRRTVVEADALLMATGRRPNLKGLNLEAAGIAYTHRGITVNDRCRTNRRHIYAIGDITGRYQFTHMSEHMGKVAAANAIFKVPMKIDTKHVPWTTYTDPELAHVGARERDLKEKGVAYKVYRFPFTRLDRAVTDGETTGLIKVFARAWNGKILGATILGTNAGELIGEYALAMRNSITLRRISDTIHPYPTYGLGVRRVADQWYAQKQSPRLVRLLQKVFRYRGVVIEPDPDRIV